MFRDNVVWLNKKEDSIMWLISPVAVTIGVLLGDRISAYSFLGSYMFMILTFTGAISMRTKDFVNVVRHPKPVLLFIFLGKIVLPLICGFIAKGLLPGRVETAMGYILMLTGPIAASTFIWTGIYQGNGSLTLSLLMIDTAVTPLVMPLEVLLLSGSAVDIHPVSMMLSLLKLVVIPMIVGIGANEISKNQLGPKYGVYFKPFGKLALVLAVIFNCSKVSHEITSLKLADWPILLVGIFAVIISIFGGFLISKLGKLSEPDSVSMTVCSGLKNNSATLVIANSAFTPAVALPIVLLILFQQTICALICKILFPQKDVNH